MEIYSSFWHIANALLIFIFGAAAAMAVGPRFGLTAEKSSVVYIWHTGFSLLYMWTVINFGGDAIGYYLRAKNQLVDFGFGTAAVDYMSAILVQSFDLSILGLFLVFNIAGTIGLLAFAGSLKYASHDKPESVGYLASIVIFLPSVSFWSSALGKDSLSFLSTGLALWAALNLSSRFILMAFSVFVMLLVRPHMAGMMVISLSIAAIFDPRADFKKKIILSVFSTAVCSILVPFALIYAGVGDQVGVKNLSDYIEGRQAYNMEGGGGIDISSMSLPMKFYSYMFRPMFFEVNSIFSFAAAIDNLILMYLFIAGALAFRAGARSATGENRAFMWSYALIAWFFLSMTSANLGISLRQKWMFAPMLIFLLISVLGSKGRVIKDGYL